MDNAQVNVVPVTCRLSDLTVSTTESDKSTTAAILKADDPFVLHVLIEFQGMGAIALLSLAPTIRATFAAKPFGPGTEVILGQTVIDTNPEQFAYPMHLRVESPQSLGLTFGTVYRVSTLLCIGAPNSPALINGFIQGLAMEIYPSPTSSD
ncbi:MAG: hypothetical protein AAGE59_07295 [Cyanobacteria bacterium P01_F01_bin.86]